MRIADRLRYETFKSNLQVLKERIDRNQTMIASGKRILTPSDDPVSAAKSMQLDAQKNVNTQYKRNLDKLKTTGVFYETSINAIHDALTEAKTLAMAQASDNMNADTRESAAEEAKAIFDELVTIGNTKVGGTYIFGGKKSNSPPFSADGTFNGTQNVTKVSVETGTTIESGVSGSAIFEGSGVDVFNIITDLKQHLLDNDTAGIRTDIEKIGNALDLTEDNIAYIGSYNNRIDTMLERNSVKDATLAETTSDLVDGDMAQLIADFNTLSTAYQSVLYDMSKLQDLTVLNYLR
jgi:flagellar hook-associated protein 3 FlgL